MELFERMHKKYVTLIRYGHSYHADKMRTEQYFRYRSIARAIEALPPLDDQETRKALTRQKNRLTRLLLGNF